jgi:hypothetical protein
LSNLGFEFNSGLDGFFYGHCLPLVGTGYLSLCFLS